MPNVVGIAVSFESLVRMNAWSKMNKAIKLGNEAVVFGPFDTW